MSDDEVEVLYGNWSNLDDYFKKQEEFVPKKVPLR